MAMAAHTQAPLIIGVNIIIFFGSTINVKCTDQQCPCQSPSVGKLNGQTCDRDSYLLWKSSRCYNLCWTCDQSKGKSEGKNDDKPVNSSRLLEPAHLCQPVHSLTNHQPSCIGRNKRIWKYWIFFTIHFNVLQEPIKQTETICLSQGTSANKRERFA